MGWLCPGAAPRRRVASLPTRRLPARGGVHAAGVGACSYGARCHGVLFSPGPAPGSGWDSPGPPALRPPALTFGLARAGGS